ncbi:MAG: alpha-amylase family glycosyl hydrolase [Chloroflexi bacterium]|nr:alpha-amylase family glycosyl hydrolase [Chloroflexota bacterium]
MEFHITRRAREKYKFDQTLFSYNGNVIFANFHAVRLFAQKINEQKDLVSFPEDSIKASQLNAMGLIDEIYHHLFSVYRKEKNPSTIESTLHSLIKKIGAQKLDAILELFINKFPPLVVYAKQMTASEYLGGKTEGVLNRESLLEEFILLWISTRNPALDPFSELIWDAELVNDFRFDQITGIIEAGFKEQPVFGPQNQSLIEILRTPAIQVPHSITGQLEFIREHWGFLLGDYLFRLLTSLDLIKEENKFGFMGPGPVAIPLYDQKEFLAAGGKDSEIEAFSPDRDWMPRLVLIAKNSFVWLDQLSKKYNRPINTLDQIPDTELELLNHQGITGLWLIGLWQRSPASAKIKQLCGNPEAISSAYSLYSYQIADELGGESAYQSLRDKASHHGIRLASDMVPNHMGIDSEWVISRPDQFLTLDQCPFPSYSYNGPDLSSNPNVVIQIEDHYFDQTDAAVVFRRIDKDSGRTQFIYHGNDGTSMPWNDTAQLNYLDPVVRESVIQTILEVAKKFPIIRFDAAMTLAKKHVQRLWFPQPGSGGAIPSRSEFAMDQVDFDRAVPIEFWREVVDRIAKEAPDTLLLAEAFWLMESYFVRTLGMHRVYNSAFMHMLRNEDNAGYRKIIKNTLEFEPEILKRFVNFMNNPDERTAVEQFGKGDKYFGICTLLATLPGLPMVGHGQIEGLSEKYGMEFRRAYQNEQNDESLINRHEHEIFPLLHRRELFAGVENFHFYDCFRQGGTIEENIYAYSNRFHDQTALVVYNNQFNQAEGWIKTSVSRSNRTGNSNKNILEALGFTALNHGYLQFRDQISGLMYIRPLQEIIKHGFFLHLKGYEHHAFLDFSVTSEDERSDYDRLYALIGNEGIPNISQALAELRIQPLLKPFQEIVNPGYLEFLYDQATHLERINKQHVLQEYRQKVTSFLDGIKKTAEMRGDPMVISEKTTFILDALLDLPLLEKNYPIPNSRQLQKSIKQLMKGVLESKIRWFTLITWSVVSNLGDLQTEEDPENVALSWMEDWNLSKTFEETLQKSGFSPAEIHQSILSLRLSVKFKNWYESNKGESTQTILAQWLSTSEIQHYIKINRYNEVLWYNRESFGDLLWWMNLLPYLQIQYSKNASRAASVESILGVSEIIQKIRSLDKKSEYQVNQLVRNKDYIKNY